MHTKTLITAITGAFLTLNAGFHAVAQTTFTLNPLTSFGSRGDGSIQPGDSIGINPQSGNTVTISAPYTGGISYGVQPGDLSGATNGFNMRGIAYDPVSGNLIFVDTHAGTGGSGNMVPNSAIYVLDPNSGQILSALNTNGMVGGSYTHVVAGVASDGVVYICNQTTASTTTGFKIYRWTTADTNSPNFGQPPIVAFTNTLSPSDRLGQTMDVRGSGTNTQIIVGSSSANGTGTNVYFFDTTDGTNFSPHRIFFPGITTAMFNDGIAFGPTNTFFAKQVGQPLLYLSYDPVTFAGSIISEFAASSQSGSDPLLNLAGITVDNANQLLAGVEEINGTATGGRGKVWLFAIPNPTNQAPAILSSRTYIPNFQKATATMGYLHFAPGKLYANVVNNGMLASTVDSITMPAPGFTLPPDFPGGQPKVTDLPATNRIAVGQNAHFEVFATPDVTNYQWYSNSTLLPGAATYFLDVTNAQAGYSGTIYKVIASNAAGSVESVHSTLLVVNPADYFHPVLLWSVTANTTALSSTTNFITSNGGSSTPNERTIAYNALSNQLIVARGPGAFGNLKIFVINPDTGIVQYLLNTNGMTTGGALNLCGIGVADDGAVYASSVAASDASFRIYRWADTGPNTLPQLIWGTNSSAAQANPVADLTGTQLYRFGDDLAVHGAGNNTEIIVDSQNDTRFAGILRPVPDGTMTNWTQTGYLLQNIAGSYGFQAYGTAIGRGVQFGPIMPSPLGGNLPTFWQKRYNAAGTPLAGMSYNPGGGIAALNIANTGLPLYTNGPLGISFTLNMGAAVNFAGTVANNLTSPDTLDFYDLTDPSQAVLLNRQNLPGPNAGGHMANGNAIAQVIFGANPATGTNYVFAIDANNGIAAYYLSGGTFPAPKILFEPVNLRIVQGATATLAVQVDQLTTIQWFKGTNPPANTAITGTTFTINNAQLSDAGDYFAIATNLNGSATSQVAHVTVELAGDNYSLTEIWGGVSNGTSFPYVTSTGGANTPNERSFAYNALSNQLLVVSCPVNTHNYNVFVVDANTGSSLYSLNTNGVINEGASEVSGSNPLDLDSIAVADDGAVYVCSLTPNASGGQFGDTNKMLRVYRWADSGPNTAPVLVFQGDPSGQPAGLNERWGDSLAARGSGTNTQLVMNSQDGAYGALLVPTDSSMTQFTNLWFADAGGAGSIGRSLQFGPANSIFEKRKGAAAFFSTYNTTNQTSALFESISSSGTLGGVFVDTNHNLAAGVDFVGSTTAPLKHDAVALYDLSDPTTPMLINHYSFPSNQVANANFICQTVVAGFRVFSLDANNGMTAFYINPPANGMILNITRSGANVNLSWGSTDAILQGSPGINPTAWTDLTTLGQTNSLEPASGMQFYRLIVRR